jgi:hypothetical protein
MRTRLRGLGRRRWQQRVSAPTSIVGQAAGRSAR